jgi:hypothetical protein
VSLGAPETRWSTNVADDGGLNSPASRFLLGYTALVALWAILEIAWRMRRIRAKLS